MNENMQNSTIDILVDRCPVFQGYVERYHNVEVKYRGNTLCEIDDLYVFPDYVLLGENKTRDSSSCHKKMESQIRRFKKKKHYILDQLGIRNLPVYYFYAHFENETPHVEYKGMRK